LVEISSPILTLVASDRFDIFLELPEELTGQVTPGMTVELTSRVLPEWKKVQPITAVVPSADSTSRRQRVRVQIEDPPPGLLSGMAIAANLSIPSNRASFVVSRDALTRREDQWLVFKVADSKAEQIEVEMIADMGQKVAIYHPSLETGQQIVLRGGDGLQDGASVKIVN
jgi:RND family efflux transporter MFP subunit